MDANRADSDSLDIYLKLAFQGDQLPGYGWVFPMGCGRLNIGLGYVNSYRNWQSINATQFLASSCHAAPRMGAARNRGLEEEQERPGMATADGLHGVAPWRPGVLFTGDSLGAGKPASGAGISKALESGLAGR